MPVLCIASVLIVWLSVSLAASGCGSAQGNLEKIKLPTGFKMSLYAYYL